MPHERAEEPHDLNMVILRLLLRQPPKGIYPAKPDRHRLIAEHLGGPLVAVVEKTPLLIIQLLLCNVAAPDRQPQRGDGAQDQCHIANGCAQRVLTPPLFPIAQGEGGDDG